MKLHCNQSDHSFNKITFIEADRVDSLVFCLKFSVYYNRFSLNVYVRKLLREITIDVIG